MIIGLNWQRDDIIQMMKGVITSEPMRSEFGGNLKRILGKEGLIRYPGGNAVQMMSLEEKDALNDLKGPGYPFFYKFCKDFDISIIQQIPTTGMSLGMHQKKIKSTPNAKIDKVISDEILSNSIKFIKWVKTKKYFDNVAFWELGNEEWIDLEGRVSPKDYVDILGKYINAIGSLISSDKILIGAQPGQRGGVSDWGYEVLKLLKNKGLSEKIGGVTIHIYPYFFNRNFFDINNFDFNSYCLSANLISMFTSEYSRLASYLDALNYPEGIKIHITEMSIEIPGPPRESDGWLTFKNNRKNYATAVAAARSFMSVIEHKRIGSLIYFSLFHRYLVAPEEKNPTPWKGYTSVSDWGFGNIWYLPYQSSNHFITTPLLEAWGLLRMFVAGGRPVKKYLEHVFLSGGQTEISLIAINISNIPMTLKITSSLPGHILGNGNLNRRSIKLGSHGERADITPLLPEEVALNGDVVIPSCSIFVARGKTLHVNGKKINADILNTSAFLRGDPLPLGYIDVVYQDGILVPYPDGVRIENYPLDMILGFENMEKEEICWNLFKETYSNLNNWSLERNKTT